MFDDLIIELSHRGLMSDDQKDTLLNLHLNTYQDVARSLDSTKDKDVVMSICDMIGNSIHVYGEFDFDTVSDSVVRLLSSDNWEIRRKAVQTIGNLRLYHRLSTLAKVALGDEHVYVRLFAVDAIGKLNLPKSDEILVSIIEDINEDREVRETAIEALGMSGSSKALSTLVEQLTGMDLHIRYASILALQNLQDPAAIPYIEKVLSDARVMDVHDSVNEQAIKTIQYLKMKG